MESAVLVGGLGVVVDSLNELGTESAGTTTCVIDSLYPEMIDVLKPLRVVVEPIDGDFVATFFDATISATGDTRAEALDNIKELIVADFEFFESTPDTKLGAAMKKSKNVLRSMLKRRV